MKELSKFLLLILSLFLVVAILLQFKVGFYIAAMFYTVAVFAFGMIFGALVKSVK